MSIIQVSNEMCTHTVAPWCDASRTANVRQTGEISGVTYDSKNAVTVDKLPPYRVVIAAALSTDQSVFDCVKTRK